MVSFKCSLVFLWVIFTPPSLSAFPHLLRKMSGLLYTINQKQNGNIFYFLYILSNPVIYLVFLLTTWVWNCSYRVVKAPEQESLTDKKDCRAPRSSHMDWYEAYRAVEKFICFELKCRLKLFLIHLYLWGKAWKLYRHNCWAILTVCFLGIKWVLMTYKLMKLFKCNDNHANSAQIAFWELAFSPTIIFVVI